MIAAPEDSSATTETTAPENGERPKVLALTVVPAEQLVEILLPGIRSAVLAALSEIIFALLIGVAVAVMIRNRYDER